MKEDSRFLNDYFKFDKILLDSPCSGSGTNSVFGENFSKELVERLVKVQEALLRKALNLLSSNGIVVYSTCSILKEENEKILEKVSDISEIIPINEFEDKNIKYLKSSNGTLTIFPNSYYEGFFVSKLRKK